MLLTSIILLFLYGSWWLQWSVGDNFEEKALAAITKGAGSKTLLQQHPVVFNWIMQLMPVDLFSGTESVFFRFFGVFLLLCWV